MTAPARGTGPRIALVVAVADNGVIGRNGALPWHLPDDLKHFKQVTLGKPILMGRRTFESIGRALPGRRNLVLSHGPALEQGAVEFVSSVEQAVALTSGCEELCVIGGAHVFDVTLPLATRVYLTRVHGDLPGDTYFPLQALSHWRELERREHEADARHAYPMTFVTLERT